MKKTEQPNTDTALLVKAAQQGDREAMTVLYERTNQQIWQSIRAMIRDEELAKDVQQETYLHAFQSISQLREPEKLRPWLHSIAMNQAKNALTKKSPLLFSELSEEDTEQSVPEDRAETQPETAAEAKEQAELINQVLSALPDGQRLIVGMYYYEQLSTGEIAEKLGLSKPTVRSQLHRGRKNIERALSALRKKGLQLYSLGFFPFFLKSWRQQTGAKSAVDPILSRLPQQTAELAVTSGKAVIVTRIAAAAAAVCLLGGLAYGANHLQKQHRLGDVRPEDDRPIYLQTDPGPKKAEDKTEPIRPEPTEAIEPTEATEPAETTEPTEPAEEPSIENPIEQPTEAQNLLPSEVPPAETAPAEPSPDATYETAFSGIASSAGHLSDAPNETEAPGTEPPEAAAAASTEPAPAEDTTEENTPDWDPSPLPTNHDGLPSPQTVSLSVRQYWSYRFTCSQALSVSCCRTSGDDPGSTASPYCSFSQHTGAVSFEFMSPSAGTFKVDLILPDGSSYPWLTIHVA